MLWSMAGDYGQDRIMVTNIKPSLLPVTTEVGQVILEISTRVPQLKPSPSKHLCPSCTGLQLTAKQLPKKIKTTRHTQVHLTQVYKDSHMKHTIGIQVH